MLKSSITAVVFTLALGAIPAFAQTTKPTPEQQPPARAAQPTMVRGELVSVDETAKSITVKTADNAEVKFAFDDKTEVTGAKDAAGLATMSASRVTVHYKEDAAKNKLATRIIVEPKK
jgi:hypothetical protein